MVKLSNTITVSVLPANGWIKYNHSTVYSRGDLSVGYGLAYRIKPPLVKPMSGYWQYAIGINRRKYFGTVDLHGFKNEINLVEPTENHRYTLYQVFNSMESQTVTYIEPLFRAEYVQPLSSSLDWLIGFGLGAGIHYSETHAMTGSYKRYAYYYENHNLIEDMPPEGLGVYTDFLNPVSNKIFRANVFVVAETGFRFKLSDRWEFHTLLDIQSSVNNIQAVPDVFLHHESYSGMAASRIDSRILAISAGGEIGLSFRLAKSYKQTKTSFSPVDFAD